MLASIPYCGAPPHPGELLTRFNLDPVLFAVLLLLTALHIRINVRRGRGAAAAITGWAIAAVAFMSPLCALSVSLFAARIAQHMLLLLLAAPLIASTLPASAPRRADAALLGSAALFCVALWFWHMPGPYDATFGSTLVYWAMHCTLFGSGILLWRELLHHRADKTAHALALGLFTSVHMGLLGAVLALASRPLFFPHYLTTAAWGLTPLQDQQLGGAIMWVPGMILFLFVAVRSLRRLWSTLEGFEAT